MSAGLYSGVSGLALGIGLYRNVSGLWGGASGLINGFGGADPYAGASLYLNFLDPTLDSRITFSRGTNATLVDSTGKLTYAPNNTVTNSVGPTFSTGGTASTVAGAAPDGTNAVRLTKTDATTPRYSAWSTAMSSQSNTAYVVSAYFKYDGFNTTVSLEYNNTINWGIGWVATFSVTAAGITADAPSLCTSGVQGVGNGWFRVWAAFTTTTVTSASNPTILSRITGGNGTTVLVAWGQVEQVTYQTTPSTYVATTASAYYGPRFDYDPVTLAPRGLLIEEARTNLLTYSEAISTGYAPVRATLVNNATSAPSGVVNATKLVEDTTATSTHIVGGTITAGATSSFSVFAKAAERTWLYVVSGTATAYFDLSTGAVGTTANCTGSTVNMGNGWYRCIISNFTTSSSVYVGPATGNGGASYTGNGTSGLYLWGLQLEAGSFATSYIPTVASTVTRNADVATMTGTNFSSWYNQSAGTFVIGLTPRGVPTGGANIRFLEVNDGTATSRNPLMFASAVGAAFTQYRVAGADQANLGSSTSYYAANSTIAIGAAYATNDFATSFSGGAVQTDASGSVVTNASELDIGYARSGAGTEIFCGHIRTIAYFNTRLPNAQLQTLTAPSLATTLSLDFTTGSYNVGF